MICLRHGRGGEREREGQRATIKKRQREKADRKRMRGTGRDYRWEEEGDNRWRGRERAGI